MCPKSGSFSELEATAKETILRHGGYKHEHRLRYKYPWSPPLWLGCLKPETGDTVITGSLFIVFHERVNHSITRGLPMAARVITVCVVVVNCYQPLLNFNDTTRSRKGKASLARLRPAPWLRSQRIRSRLCWWFVPQHLEPAGSWVTNL